MNRSRSILFVAACSVVLASAFSSSSLGGGRGGGGGGHGGGGHGGGGHGGGGHGGGGHSRGGHGGGGHGGFSRGGGGHGGGGHSRGGGGHGGYSSHGGGQLSHSGGTNGHVGGLGAHGVGHGGNVGGHGGIYGGGHYGGGNFGGGHFGGGNFGGHHGGFYGGLYGGGHFGGGHFGHPAFGFNFYPWYGGVGIGFGGGGYGYYNRPYYASYSPAIGQQVIVQPVVAQEIIAEAPPLAAETQVGSKTPDQATTPEGLYFQRFAEKAFLGGRYQEAARHAQHALVEMPRDGKLLLFMSQTLFAIGDYQGAAGTIHQGVSLLDPKDWGYVVENYKNIYRGNGFVTQMNQLNEYLKKNPEAAYAHFVRGYQHGFIGNKKTAIKELTMAVELESRDQLAVQLLVRFGGNPPEPAVPAEAPLESEVKP